MIMGNANKRKGILPLMIILFFFPDIKVFNDISFVMHGLCAQKNTITLEVIQSRMLFCLILFCL